MDAAPKVYHSKVDSSGRIVLPAELRARHFIAEGDTLVLVEDNLGLHLKTREQIRAEIQAYFATLAPASVMLSEEILAEHHAESDDE